MQPPRPMTPQRLRAELYLRGASFRYAGQDLQWDIPFALPIVVQAAVYEHWGDLVKEANARPDQTVRPLQVPTRYAEWPC